MNKLTIIITGCSSGIGKSLLIELLKKKNIVIIGICRNKSELKNIEDKKLFLIECDLLKMNEVKKLILKLKKIKNINVLINNAGSIFYENKKIFKNLTKTYFLNFFIPFLLSVKLKNNFQEKKQNLILNIGSNANKIYPINQDDVNFEDNYFGFKSYAKSKSILLHITQKLGKMKDNVESCYVHPGLLKTKISKNMPFFFKSIYNLVILIFGSKLEISTKFIVEKIILKKNVKNHKYFDLNNFSVKEIQLENKLTNKIWFNSHKIIKKV